MKRFDLQRLLPAHLAYPMALAVEATGPRVTGAALLYAGHRLLRLLLAGRDGWSSRAAGFGRFRDLCVALLEPDASSGRGPLAGLFSDALRERVVSRAVEDLAAAADQFLPAAATAPEANLGGCVDEIEDAFARLADALGDLSVCTAGPSRPDILYSWSGPRGFVASREALECASPSTVVRTLGTQVVVGPATTGSPPLPLLPFCGPEGTSWWEDPEGRVFDSDAATGAPLAPLSASRALGRLVQWHIEPGQDGTAVATTLVGLNEAEAAGEVLSSAMIWAAPSMSAVVLDRVRDFLAEHGLAEQLAATDAFLLRRLETAEASLRAAGDWAGVANALLQRQMIEKGQEKVLTVQRLANVFRERQNDRTSAFYCLLSAIEQEPGDTSLLQDLAEDAPEAGAFLEGGTRLLDLSRTRKGRERAELARVAGRFLSAAGQPRKSFEAFLTALDGVADDPSLLEEASAAAAAVGDHEALLALLARRRDAAPDNASRLGPTLEAAALLEKMGRVDEAAAEYRRALTIDPNHRQAFDALVSLLTAAGRLDEARTEYVSVLSRTFDPGMRSVVLRRYAALLTAGPGGEVSAIAALEEALALDPADLSLLDQLEPLYERTGQWAKLISLWRRRLAADQGDAVRLLLGMAEVAETRIGDLESALGFACEAASRAPQDAEVRRRLRHLHEAVGLWGEVARDLEREAEIANPADRPAILAELGETYERRLSLWGRAKAAYARALEGATGPLAIDIGKRLAALHRRDQEREKEFAALEVAVKAMTDDAAADHLAEMGRRALEPPADGEAARGYLEAAVRLNPVHAGAVETLAALLMSSGQPERVPALVEPLAVKAASAGDHAVERRLRLLAGEAAARLGDVEAAIVQYARAAELSPTDALTRVLLGRLHARAGRDAEALALLSGVLDGEAGDLSLADRIEIHVQSARCAARLGDHVRALDLLEMAYRLKGAPDPEVLRELVAEAEAAKDARRLADYLDRAVAIEGSSTQRFALMLRLGDVWKDDLKDPATGLRWYRAAAKENPSSKAALHKALDAAVASGDYAEAKSILLAVLELEQDGLRRAQYHYGAALIARDNLGDLALAREHLAQAIELNPDLEEAVAAHEDLLVRAGDHEGLASLYNLLARHYRLGGQEQRMLDVLRRLAASYDERLHNLPLAADTLRQILAVAPDDVESAQRLASVLTRTPGKEKEALDAHRVALAIDPTHAPSYRAVRELCLVTGDTDGAWCASAALVALGQATEAEEAAFEAGRQAALKLKRDSLPPDTFRRLILDDAANEGVARVLHILTPPLRRLLPNMWKRPGDLGMSEADLVNPSERGLFQNMAAAASKVFGIPLPRVYRARGRAGIAKVPFDPPALAVGDDVLTVWRGKELRFSVARALVSFMPGFLLSGIADPATLRVFFLSGLRIAFPDYPLPADAEGVEELAAELMKLLPPDARAELVSILTEFRRRKTAIDLQGFLAGVDRTAARAGLFMANDLAVAKNQLADDSLFLSDLEFGDRLTDLCGYAVSARYSELRRLMLQV